MYSHIANLKINCYDVQNGPFGTQQKLLFHQFSALGSSPTYPTFTLSQPYPHSPGGIIPTPGKASSTMLAALQHAATQTAFPSFLHTGSLYLLKEITFKFTVLSPLFG